MTRRIGFYVHWAAVGGAEDMVIDEIRYLDNNEFHPIFFTEEQSGEGPYLDELRAMGVEVIRTDGRVETFRDLYQQRVIELLHVYSCGDVLPGYRAALELGLPVVDSIACVAYSAGWEVAPSLVTPVYLCQKHWEHGGGGRAEFKVITGGVDFERLPVAGIVGCKKHWGLDPARRVLGWFGRMDQFKCPFTFVDIARRVSAEMPDVQFIMFGDGHDWGRTQFLAKEAKVDIKFPGFTREKAIAFGAMDVYCFPTWQEAFGRVMVEAMAIGVPIVTADYPVCHEVCDQFALYIENARKDPMPEAVVEKYAQACIDLLRVGGRSVGSIRHVSERFDARRMAREYQVLYKELMEKRNGVQ